MGKEQLLIFLQCCFHFIEYRFNRLLLYRANLIHSASEYCGQRLADKRMAAVFFWMA